MKRLPFPVTLLLFAVLLAGCSSVGGDDEPDAVLLRLENGSSADFSSALVRFPEAEAGYGALAAGEASDYREFDTAYSFGFVKIEAGGNTYRIQPIDYVGEEPLENGRYTYELSLTDGELEMEFAQD